jgi:cytidylate kinase
MRGKQLAQIPVITIDGPSGTGKGTISQRLSEMLQWHFLDSGVLYRVLALAAKQHAVETGNEATLEVLAAHLDVQFKLNSSEQTRVILEGADVTDAIRSEECGSLASQIGAFPKVRVALLERQRAFRELPGLVTDGRDMGTVVFPDAILKIYLKADDEERALRRFQQLKDKGVQIGFDDVLSQLRIRDARDIERAVSPLKPAEDAVIIDTTGLSIEQVLTSVLELAHSRIDAFKNASTDA